MRAAYSAHEDPTIPLRQHHACINAHRGPSSWAKPLIKNVLLFCAAEGEGEEDVGADEPGQEIQITVRFQMKRLPMYKIMMPGLHGTGQKASISVVELVFPKLGLLQCLSGEW